MEKYQVNVTLSNGIEINFSKEASTKEALFGEISDHDGWYEHEEKGYKQYFKTNTVVSIRIYEEKRASAKLAGY